jgi:hypothetical protein
MVRLRSPCRIVQRSNEVELPVCLEIWLNLSIAPPLDSRIGTGPSLAAVKNATAHAD